MKRKTKGRTTMNTNCKCDAHWSDDNATHTCPNCNIPVCDECTSHCANCGKEGCWNCVGACAECDTPTCDQCGICLHDGWHCTDHKDERIGLLLSEEADRTGLPLVRIHTLWNQLDPDKLGQDGIWTLDDLLRKTLDDLKETKETEHYKRVGIDEGRIHVTPKSDKGHNIHPPVYTKDADGNERLDIWSMRRDASNPDAPEIKERLDTLIGMLQEIRALID